MRKELRPYQEKAVQSLKQKLKETTHPLLVTASVGAGKSLMIASVLQWIEAANYKALCLTLNSTLIQQNSQTYKDQGGTCGIYCSGLNAKDTTKNIIFGSPQSIASDIRDNGDISKIRFNLIVIDEAHNINPHDKDTMFQRIINHYGHKAQTYRYSYRIVGLTGTPYRGKGISIIGKDQFFKEEVCNIGTSWLISQSYLTKPEFGLIEGHSYDFSKIRVNPMGKFSNAELQAVIDSNARLTGQIMQELQVVMQNRKGAFIFASTRKHCQECARSLPHGEWAIITGETPHEERKTILERARNGDIKYLVSVSCLNVGVDVPSYDVCAWLRPTESLVLYTQGIGRVLRLHPEKQTALILDYAGNILRHGDIDDPIINEALQPREENEKDYIIPCLQCGTNNTVHARRCIGVDQYSSNRCNNFFEWKDCESCGTKNDKTSRHCRECQEELIDPNAKLHLKALKPTRESFFVDSAKYWVLEHHHTPSFNAMYTTQEGLRIYESYLIRDSRTANIFYGNFVRDQVENASSYYPVLNSTLYLKRMIHSKDIRTPYKIDCIRTPKLQIKKKYFHESMLESICK